MSVFKAEVIYDMKPYFNVGDIVLIESVTEVLYKMVGNFDPSWGRTKQYAGMNTTYRVYAENGKVYREVDLKPITNNKHLKDLFKKYPNEKVEFIDRADFLNCEDTEGLDFGICFNNGTEEEKDLSFEWFASNYERVTYAIKNGLDVTTENYHKIAIGDKVVFITAYRFGNTKTITAVGIKTKRGLKKMACISNVSKSVSDSDEVSYYIHAGCPDDNYLILPYNSDDMDITAYLQSINKKVDLKDAEEHFKILEEKLK